MAEIERQTLPDILAPDLDVIIVGFNPSLVSWKNGHHYANPVNNFYRLLYRAGLTPHLLKPEEDVNLPQYGIGLTNFVVDIPSANETAVPASVYRASRATLDEKVIHYRPRLVSFNGLKLYQYYFGKKLVEFGLQKEVVVGGCPLFVTPSSSGAANMYYERRQELYSELKSLIDSYKAK
ncbi:MAG TPA: mismatch-specific DNA-glycosylase [Chloroflexia bacterium]|nr:mismatch-specific DNA-glycosylase [Chloroflexia bacterium]